ncbi:hypothetical protein AAJ76_4770001, partial [Vairimorpha ceranae]
LNNVVNLYFWYLNLSSKQSVVKNFFLLKILESAIEAKTWLVNFRTFSIKL